MMNPDADAATDVLIYADTDIRNNPQFDKHTYIM